MNNLIGRQCKGFKFEDKGIFYLELMDESVGEVGEIIDVIEDRIKIQFKHNYFYYPLDQSTEHLVPEEIEIPEIGEGILMEVSNHEDFEESYEESVLLMYKNRFVALDEEGHIYAWEYARPIQEKVTLTKQEIADKFEIDINQLEITN